MVSHPKRVTFIDREARLKECSACHEVKSFDEFHKNKSTSHGLQSRCKPCHIAQVTPYTNRRYQLRKRDPQFSRQLKSIHLRRAYGITHDEFDAMVARQGHRCAICRRRKKRLVVDHDHRRGRVRALLCDTCNAALGGLQDDPELMRRAAAYIEYHGRKD